MQVNPESCILYLSSPSDSKLSAFSNQSLNPFLNHAHTVSISLSDAGPPKPHGSLRF